MLIACVNCLSQECFPDGSITIRKNINEPVPTRQADSLLLNMEKLLCLANLHLSRTFSDMSIPVAGATLPCHKAMHINRGEYF